MPISKSYCARWFFICLLLIMMVSCRSERVAFDFAPATGTKPLLQSEVAIINISSNYISSVLHLETINSVNRLKRPSRLRPLFRHDITTQKTAIQRLIVHKVQKHFSHREATSRAPMSTPTGWGWGLLLIILAGLIIISGLSWAVAGLFGLGFWQVISYVGWGLLGILVLALLAQLFTFIVDSVKHT